MMMKKKEKKRKADGNNNKNNDDADAHSLRPVACPYGCGTVLWFCNNVCKGYHDPLCRCFDSPQEYDFSRL